MERIEEFIEALKEKGIRIWSDNEKLRYQAAKGAMDSQTLEKIKEKKVEILEFLNNKSDIEVVFKSNQAERYEPFPLTNIQNSYVIGRNSAYELGDVTCHGYIEITYQEVPKVQGFCICSDDFHGNASHKAPGSHLRSAR